MFLSERFLNGRLRFPKGRVVGGMKENELRGYSHRKERLNYYENTKESDEFQRAAEFFKQLGDATRIRIFWILCHQEANVSYLAKALQISGPAIVHHLKTLGDCQLLISRREGKEVYYKISDSPVGRMMHIMVEEMLEITCPEKNIDEQSSAEEIVFQIHDYLIGHMEERITIEELSKKFLINQTTLKQVFKKVYGSSIAAHMKEHRLEKAAELLKKNNDSIALIAKRVGYESQSKFSKSFQEKYGMLPSEYRKVLMGYCSCQH